MVMAPSFLVSRVMHKRMRPRAHLFNYGVFYLCFPLSRINELKNPFLSLNRWNLLSFYNNDHGARDGSDLAIWIHKTLDSQGIPEADGEILLITLPRILGYVFNPVSFWLCLDKAGKLRAVLSEVSNTFGEHHSYISFHSDLRPIEADDWLESQKMFHVSPFLDPHGTYRFRFAIENGKIVVHINLFDHEGLLLTTSITGRMKPMTSTRTLAMLFNYPLMTIKIITLIHFEALRLLAKGLRYRAKPMPPTQEITR